MIKIKSFSTIELLTAVAVLAVLFTAGIQVFDLAVRTASQTKDFITAELLARDLIELTISKRNEDWNSLAPGEYYFVEDEFQGFLFTPGEETLDRFTRSITISEVSRDFNGNVVASGGTLDEEVYKVVARVDWQYANRDFNIELTQYLTDWRRF